MLEIVEAHAGDAWRAVYTVGIANAVYVLHFFPEEIEKGQSHAAAPYGADTAKAQGGPGACQERTDMTVRVTKSSGNVFADLGVKNPDEHALKAELVRQIAVMLDSQGLNQTEAARRLQIAQPDVSRMLRGHFRQFSVARLMRFLAALGQDVEIVVRRPQVPRLKGGRVTVIAEG